MKTKIKKTEISLTKETYNQVLEIIKSNLKDYKVDGDISNLYELIESDLIKNTTLRHKKKLKTILANLLNKKTIHSFNKLFDYLKSDTKIMLSDRELSIIKAKIEYKKSLELTKKLKENYKKIKLGYYEN
jgi:hypothetical protein